MHDKKHIKHEWLLKLRKQVEKVGAQSETGNSDQGCRSKSQHSVMDKSCELLSQTGFQSGPLAVWL